MNRPLSALAELAVDPDRLGRHLRDGSPVTAVESDEPEGVREPDEPEPLGVREPDEPEPLGVREPDEPEPLGVREPDEPEPLGVREPDEATLGSGKAKGRREPA